MNFNTSAPIEILDMIHQFTRGNEHFFKSMVALQSAYACFGEQGPEEMLIWHSNALKPHKIPMYVTLHAAVMHRLLLDDLWGHCHG